MIDGGAEGHIASGKALRDGHDIRLDLVMRERPPGSAAAGTAHHFVGDQNHSVPIADVAHQARVAIGGRHNAARGADDRLEDEGRHVARAKAQNLFLQLPCAMLSNLGRSYTGRRPVSVGRRKM